MTPSTRTKAVCSIVPVLLVLSACAGASTSTPDPFGGAEVRSNEVRIDIENDNFYDARVYAHVDGVRRLLGSVGGKTQGVFRLPLTFSQDMQFEIDMLAGPTCMTERLPVDPGDSLRLQILSNPLGDNYCR